MKINFLRINTLHKARFFLCVAAFLYSLFFVKILSKDTLFIAPHDGDDAGYLAYSKALFVTGNLDWCDPGFQPNGFMKRRCTPFWEGLEDHPKIFNPYTVTPALLLSPVVGTGVLLNLSLIHI